MPRAHTPRESFVYGLRDPRIEDPVLSIRYIGQTSVGLSRPKAHTHAATALKSDGNKHKAHWLNQLKHAGLAPEIVVLQRVDAAVEGVAGPTALDVAERCLIETYRQAGAALTNIQDGGTSGYVLTAEERTSISEAKAWQPKAQTIATINADAVTGAWSQAKAWWLGLMYARGLVHTAPGRRYVELRTESLELAEKWLAVCDAPARMIRLLPDTHCWCASLGDVRIAKWLVDTYAFQDKWSGGLDWPADIPDAFVLDFARGIWDAKGHMECTPRVGRQPMMRTSVESNAWRASFAEAFVARVGGCCTFRGVTNAEGRVAQGLAARGASTSAFLGRLYGEAPASLCSLVQQCRAADACRCWHDALRNCELCDAVIASGTRCATCLKRKWVGTSCACGQTPVVALGLCAACYRVEWTRRRQDWTRDPGLVSKLDAYDIAGWQGASDIEQEQRLDELLTLYRSRGFPWFVFEAADVDGVLLGVRNGKLTVDDPAVRFVSSAGQPLCTKAHPQRLRASYRGYPSVVTAFDDDRCLRKALRFQLKQGDPVTPKRVLRALSALYKGPTNFSPVLARWVVDTYAPQGGVVLDPCMGYGGRLLGAVASARDVRYVGFDIEAKTVAGNQRLLDWLGVAARGDVRHDDAARAEWPASDLVFTGPPYFDREEYGASAEHVTQRYTTLLEWVEGFLGTLVVKALQSAPVAVFNIGSIHAGGLRHPLPEMLEALVGRRGGVVEKSWRWELPTFGKSRRDERLMVVRRA